MNALRNIAAALIVIFTLGGCESLGLTELSPSAQHTARIATKLGVQVGVLEYVGQDEDRAKRVKRGAEAVKALVSSEADLDIYEVQDTVNGLIDEHVASRVSPQQVMLLKNAVTLIVVDIEEIVPSGVLNEETRDRVLFYIDAVIEAVSLVAGPEEEVALLSGDHPIEVTTRSDVFPGFFPTVEGWGYIPTRDKTSAVPG